LIILFSLVLKAKRKVNITIDKVEKYINEGRGQGVLEQYKPWLTIQSFPSMGRVTRLKGYKTGRIHHLLSELELMYFYMLEWDQDVYDIREHFPLFDLGIVIDQNKIVTSKKTLKLLDLPYIFATNFLVTYKDKDGSLHYAARSIKYEKAIEKTGVTDKLKLQQLYWAKKEVEFKVVTEKDINIVKAKNIESIHTFLISDSGLIDKELLTVYAIDMIKFLFNSRDPITKSLEIFEHRNELYEGTGLKMLKYLIAHRKITVDMECSLDFFKPFNKLITEVDYDPTKFSL